MKTPPLPRWLPIAPDSIAAQEQQLGRSGWAPFVHLVWSIWVFITPMFGGGAMGYTALWLGLTVVTFPVFLALYTTSVVTSERRAQLSAGMMVLLCFSLLPWYPSGLSYFVFGCVMLQPRRRGAFTTYLGMLLVSNMGLLTLANHVGYPWQALVWMPIITMIIAIVIWVERHSRAQDAALKLSHDEVRRLAAMAERERIGRDLHDLLGHTLSMVALKADLAERLLDKNLPAARAEIAAVGNVARQALAQVRGAVSGMRSAEIAAELASAKVLLETDGISLDYRLSDAFSQCEMTGAVKAALAMVVREAATNIQRHAHARQATIRFAVEADCAVLEIEDDGHGGALIPGNGLTGMRERITAVAGTLRVEPAQPRGTRLCVRVPLRQPMKVEAAA